MRGLNLKSPKDRDTRS